MSEITPNSKGPAPVQLTPEATKPVFIPVDQAKPEDIGTLSIEYRDGRPVIVVNGGKYVPAGLTVIDGAGNTVKTYMAGADDGPGSDWPWLSEYTLELARRGSVQLP
ncbi:hypothetical protein [Streptomyces sp. NPDC058701]|uniref:hypothetical protein n=1 Tax=Streptomyces sp. NPDC058701 TaxID=3346608 RepID=UPI003668FE2C